MERQINEIKIETQIQATNPISQHTDSGHDNEFKNFKATTCSRKFNNKHMVQELERSPYLLQAAQNLEGKMREFRFKFPTFNNENKVLKLQVKIGEENEVKIKLIVENEGHVPKLDGRRAQEHLKKLGRRMEILSPFLMTSL